MKSFTAFQLGDIQLKNKIVMAPMTRTRAINYIPNKLIAEYYGQRASAGLIITEGTSPSANGLGYPRIPGAYSNEQIQGWKGVANTVHTKGGKIFVQLMHTGRVSAKINMPDGATIVGPSPIQAAGQIFSETGMEDHGMPKEMTKDDVLQAQEEFVYASHRLINEAGIDGVELHAANGYLLDQFINPKSNQRIDEYGGSVKNRNRFVIETAQKVADKVGANKVGIRISPFGVYNDLQSDYAEVEETYIALAKELKSIGLVYMHIVVQEDSFGVMDARTDRQLNLRKAIKNNFEGPVITGGNVSSIETADAILNDGFDLTYVGRPYISNPDFIERLKNNVELQVPNPETFFGIDAVGFTDYPFAHLN